MCRGFSFASLLVFICFSFFESLRDVLILKAAGAPRAPYFSLLAQRKVSKRRGTLLPWPSASLRSSRSAARKELAIFDRSDTFSLLPQSTAVLSTSEGTRDGLFKS
jgi:hypothetical protein